MGVGYCFIIRWGRIYQIQLAADKALVQRLSFNMFAASLFNLNGTANIQIFQIMQEKTKKEFRFRNSSA